jgi:hypothetical protein
VHGRERQSGDRLGENGWGRCGKGVKVDEKGQKEFLRRRAMDFGTRKVGRLKGVRVGIEDDGKVNSIEIKRK